MSTRTDTRPTITSQDGWGIWSNLQENDDNVFENVRIEGPRRHIWSSHNESDKKTRLKFDKLYVYGNATWDGPLWGSRCYNVDDFQCTRSEFTKIGNFNGTHQFEGHAIYHNQLGPFFMSRCFVHECLGQGVQLVWRAHETLLEDEPEGDVVIHKCHFRNCSMHADRGSYPISVFDTGQGVKMRKVNVWTTQATPQWWNHRTQEYCRSRGAIFCGGANKARFVADRVNVVLMDPDRSAVKLERFTEVNWRGGFLANNGEINRRLKIELNDCPKGSITDLGGDFEIKHDGQIVAVNEDYVW